MLALNLIEMSANKMRAQMWAWLCESNKTFLSPLSDSLKIHLQ